MNPLNRIESLIFMAGGALMVIGALTYIIPPLRFYAPLLFTTGALCYATMQMLARYEGTDFIIRRLRRQQLLSDVLLIVSAGLMMMQVWRIGPIRGGWWLFTLTIAVVLQLYTAFRLPHELNKDK